MVHGLHKRFGEVKALQDVAFRVAPGEIAALLGPNGAGKSTLIRILATSVLPDRGHAAVSGFDVVEEAASVRQVLGLMLGDERSFYARLSGRENLEFFAAMHGLPRRVASGLCSQLLERVGLCGGSDPGLADRPYRFWSSGMRARLALARALLGGPRVLLLDEPTGHLDPTAAQELQDMVRTLAPEERLAVLFATHNLQEAAGLATFAVVLSGGRLHEVVPGPLDAARLEQVVRGARGAK